MNSISRFLVLCAGSFALSMAAPSPSPVAMSSARSLGMSSSTEAAVESPLLQAQRLYAQGAWVQAAAAYETACAVLPKVEKVPCRHWSVLALVQTGSPEDFWKASARLDTLLSLTEPENTYFAELLLTRSRLHLLQGNVPLTVRTWKMSAAANSPALAIPLFQLCEDISRLDTLLVKECPRYKPKDSSLLAAPRIPTQPLAALQSSSSALAASSSSVLNAGPATTTANVPAGTGWVLQVGAFGVKDNAKMQVDNLKKQKVKARIAEKAGANRVLYVVVTDAFATREAAQEYGTKTLQPLKLDYQVVPAP